MGIESGDVNHRVILVREDFDVFLLPLIADCLGSWRRRRMMELEFLWYFILAFSW